MSGDEFLRGIMSQGYIAARQKIYTVEVKVANTVPAHAKTSYILQFDKWSYFLNTNILSFTVTNPSVEDTMAVSYSDALFRVKFLRSSGRTYSFKDMINVGFAQTINEQSDWTQYNCYDPGEQLYIEVENLVADTEQWLVLSFLGVEFKYPSSPLG